MCCPNELSQIVFLGVMTLVTDVLSLMPEAEVASLVCLWWVGWVGRRRVRRSVVRAIWFCCCPRDCRRRAQENSRKANMVLVSMVALPFLRTPGCSDWATELAVPLSHA